jgi:hypothetical protein
MGAARGWRGCRGTSKAFATAFAPHSAPRTARKKQGSQSAQSGLACGAVATELGFARTNKETTTMKRYLAWLAALSVLTGCIRPETRVTSYRSDVGGDVDMLVDNELPSPPQPREVIWLDAYRMYRGTSRVYYFQVRYLATAEVGFIEIEPGQSLTIIADGETIKLSSTSGSLNERNLIRGGAFASEKALYEVSREQLITIAKAKKVVVQVKGSKGLVEREFGQRNYDDFRAFVTRFAL